MTIGIDASRISVSHRTGTENYSYNVIYQLARVDTRNTYTLYFRTEPEDSFWSQLTNDNPNFSYKVIRWPRLWTQGGLALELLVRPVDVMFISSHTMPVLHMPGQKFVVTIHGLEYMYMKEYEQFPHKLYLTKSTEFVSRFADTIVAVSEFTKNSLLEHGWGATDERITVIPEGVQTEYFYPRGDEEISKVLSKYDVTQPYIFFISTIQPRKNVAGLLEAFAMFIAEVNGDIQLVLAGGHGYKFDEVVNTISKFGLENNVKILDRIPDEDVPALYSAAEASVYPSFVEGFGLPVLESMACGTPVVCSNTGALPEVGGDAAVYVDPYDTESIANGLARVVTDKTLQTDLQQKGLERVKQFTWETTARELIKTFESVG